MTVVVSPQQSHAPLPWTPRNLSNRKICAVGLAIIGLFYIARVDENNHNSTNAIRADPSSPSIKRHITTLDKVTGEETTSQWHSSFPEKIIPPSERKPDDQIRYAGFGSSQTWGSALDDRETEAYVKVLSLEHGFNYGIRSSGPNYPAACTHSMIGDEEFDVIVMEYFMVANAGMLELAKRLRERFPDAILVIARFWDTPMLVNKYQEDLRTWANERKFGGGFIHNEEFKEEFLHTFDDNEWQWMFQTKHNDFIETHEEIARETGSYIIPMAVSNDAVGENGYLEIGDKMLGPDSFHPSKLGHEDFANRVKALVDRVGVPKNPVIREFSSIDYCLNWFQTGVIGEGLKYSDNAVVRKMPNTEKYGLEFEGKDEPSWIEMTNPSNEIMQIFVAYMTTGPPPSKYPKTEAIREDGDGTKKIIRPVAFRGGNPRIRVHVSDLVYMGEVKSNETAKVSFKSLEDTEWPFRIVQAVLTGRADFGTSYFTMPDSSRLHGITDAA